MKKILTIAAALTAFSLCASAQGISVRGKVIDLTHSLPLRGVYVTDGNKGSQTDRNGEFIIEGLTPGVHTFTTMYYSSFSTDRISVDLTKDTSLVFYISEEALKLEDVVVTGTRSERRLSEAPVQTSVIKSHEIARAGSTSALEALQDNVPGLVISPNGMGNNMRIRGLNTRYVLFLVDGERMVSEGAGGNINLDQIDVNDIERIEMVNGASSALYGSNAVGAVINIITKKPVHKIQAGANVSLESHNTWRTRVDVGSRLRNLSVKAGGFRNSSSGYGFESGAFAAPYEDWGGNMSAVWNPAERTDIGATARIFTHETFNPPGTLNTKHARTFTAAAGVNGGYRSADGRNDIRASFNWNRYYDFDVLESDGGRLDKQSTATYMSARAVETFRPGEKFELVSGLEYNHEENYSIKTLGSGPVTKSLDDINAFAQASWKAFRNFDLVAGARYTWNTQFGSAFTPKLSLMWSPGDFRLRAGAGTAFRAPSIKELYYDFDHQGMFWVYGNPDLKAEKGLYTSVSAEYGRGPFNASVSGYWNIISNKITQYDVINSEGANEKYYKNVSSAVLRGVDVNLSWNFLRQLLLKASYSFCDAVDKSTGLQLESNVRHSGTVSLTWNGSIARSPFSLQVAGRLNSPKLFQSMVTGEDGSQTTELSQSKAYNIWKIVLTKPFRIGKHTIEVTFKCDNVFNFKDTSFINPGRQFLGGIRYSFK